MSTISLRGQIQGSRETSEVPKENMRLGFYDLQAQRNHGFPNDTEKETDHLTCKSYPEEGKKKETVLVCC